MQSTTLYSSIRIPTLSILELARPGFPILINGTLVSVNEIEALVVLRVKIAHLPKNIAKPDAVHETQDGTVELSEETRNVPVRVWQASSPSVTS
jgi:hypothetical protein